MYCSGVNGDLLVDIICLKFILINRYNKDYILSNLVFKKRLGIS